MGLGVVVYCSRSSGDSSGRGSRSRSDRVISSIVAVVEGVVFEVRVEGAAVECE